MAVRNKSGLEDNLGDDEIFRIRPRRNTLENLPQELLAKVDGGKLSKQGRIDKLLAQKTPAEVFAEFDLDGSGFLDYDEFSKMLPALGIYLPPPKLAKYFKQVDRDGSGQIDRAEFEMAFYAADPVTGNSLGFQPSALLHPRDAFEMFDTDNSGEIDEDEFGLLLEYMGIELSEAEMERLFKRFDTDKSGAISYKEFKTVWLRVTDVRNELIKRGERVSKWANPWKLMKRLDALLDEEEAKENAVLAEAKRWDEWRAKLQEKQLDAQACVKKAEEELALALDAAGQVYIFGTGENNEYCGTAIPPRGVDADLILRLWTRRIAPELTKDEDGTELVVPKDVPPAEKTNIRKADAHIYEMGKGKRPPRQAAPREAHKGVYADAGDSDDSDDSMEESEESYVSEVSSDTDDEAEKMEKLQLMVMKTAKGITVQDLITPRGTRKKKGKPAEVPKGEDPELTAEAAAVNPERFDIPYDLFDRDAQLFRNRQVAMNTVYLWGHSVVQGALSQSCAFAITADGVGYTWGGTNKWWSTDADFDPLAMDTNKDVQKPNDEGAFSPSNAVADYATDHQRGLPKSPDRWNKTGGWEKQAIAAVREERQIAREADARRAGGHAPKPGPPVEETGKEAWRRRKSSILLFPDGTRQDTGPSTGAIDTVKGDSEAGGGRVFRSRAKPKQKREEYRKGISKTRQGTGLPDTSITDPSQELLLPVPHVPPGSIPPDEDQKGTGFFVGGMALQHFQDGPVTPRSSMLKTTAMEGHWNGETIVDIGMKKLAKQAATADEVCERIKLTTQYFEVWEPPPHSKVRLKFMQRVLIPRLPADRMRNALTVRGDYATAAKCRNKVDLCEALADVIMVEQRHLPMEARANLHRMEDEVFQARKDGKTGKADLMSRRIGRLWGPLLPILQNFRKIRAKRAELARVEENEELEARYAMWKAKRERFLTGMGGELETTPRGKHKILHLGAVTHRGPPQRTPRGLDRLFFVTAGTHHAAVLDKLGNLYMWGTNGAGRLGVGHRGACATPTCVEALENIAIRHVSLGRNHSAAVAVGGEGIYMWGCAAEGQLGMLVEGQVWAEMTNELGFRVDVKVDQDGEVYCPVPTKLIIPKAEKIRTVACGYNHTACVTVDGRLFVWGNGNSGRLGLGPENLKAQRTPQHVSYLSEKGIYVWSVACGAAHTAITTRVEVQEGDAAVEGLTNLTGGQVMVTGAGWALGRDQLNRFAFVKEFKNRPVKQVACGYAHTAALTYDGEVWTWGSNKGGCCGHHVGRGFISEPHRVDCLYIAPHNLAYKRPTRQSSTYAQKFSYLAVNGDTSGASEAVCTHTQYDEEPWWEVDLGATCSIEKIVVYCRKPNASTNFPQRICPFFILGSVVPFTGFVGKGAAEKNLEICGFKVLIAKAGRAVVWQAPPGTKGRYVRIQCTKMSFLTLSEVEVYGTLGDVPKRSPVSSVVCGFNATMAIINQKSPEEVEQFYRRAIAANPRHAFILREFPAYVDAYEKYGMNYHVPAPVTDPAAIKAVLSKWSGKPREKSEASAIAGGSGASTAVPKLSLTTSQDRRIVETEGITSLFEHRLNDSLIPSTPALPLIGSVTAGKQAESSLAGNTASLSIADELAAANDTRSDATKARTAAVKDARTKAQRKRDARTTGGGYAVKPRGGKGSQLSIPEDNVIAEADGGEASTTTGLASPSALVVDGKRRNVGSRSVAFDADGNTSQVLTPQSLPVVDESGEGTSAVSTAGYIPDPKYAYYDEHDPEPLTKDELAARSRAAAEREKAAREAAFTTAVYSAFEKWVAKDDCVAIPGKTSECPLCYQNNKCVVCVFYEKWVIPALREQFRALMDEALKAEKELRDKARKKQDLDGEPVNPAAGVLLERGIEPYVEEKRKATGIGSKEKSRGRLSSIFGLKKKKTGRDLLDEEDVRPPVDDALPAITPHVLQHPVPGKVKPPPLTKPAWPHPVDFRVAQLQSAIDFVMEMDKPPAIEAIAEPPPKRSLGDKLRGVMGGLARLFSKDPAQQLKEQKAREKARARKRRESMSPSEASDGDSSARFRVGSGSQSDGGLDNTAALDDAETTLRNHPIHNLSATASD